MARLLHPQPILFLIFLIIQALFRFESLIFLIYVHRIIQQVMNESWSENTRGQQFKYLTLHMAPLTVLIWC